MNCPLAIVSLARRARLTTAGWKRMASSAVMIGMITRSQNDPQIIRPMTVTRSRRSASSAPTARPSNSGAWRVSASVKRRRSPFAAR